MLSRKKWIRLSAITGTALLAALLSALLPPQLPADAEMPKEDGRSKHQHRFGLSGLLRHRFNGPGFRMHRHRAVSGISFLLE